MWKLSEINIKNIVSFHEAALQISQGVATLIFGKNEDNASQPCNGSGKSSLIEAISFALTGEQLRKVKSVDEIINDTSEEAYVNVELVNTVDNTVFTISRTISRSNPQVVECHKYNASGAEIETDKTIQPTILDYNRFILNEIGLSKDDIYNNYILCDNKYESFFDCSDKNKKEIINRFSNGVIIDESIARLQEDMEPVSAKLVDAKNNVTRIQGSISAIETELDQVETKKLNAKQDRANRIAEIDTKIQTSRENIEAAEDKRDKAKARLELLKKLQTNVSKMEESDISLHDAYHQIQDICQENELNMVSDYDGMAEQSKKDLAEQQKKLADIQTEIDDVSAEIKRNKIDYTTKSEKYQKHIAENSQLQENYKAQIEKINAEIDKIDSRLDKIEANIKQNKKRRSELETEISKNMALLNGAITCPKCKHQFVVDGMADVKDVRAALNLLNDELKQKKEDCQKLNDQFDIEDEKGEKKANEIEKLKNSAKTHSDELEAEKFALASFANSISQLELQISKLQSKQTTVQNDIDRISGRIDVMRDRLFGEISGTLEGRIMNGENYIEQQDNTINFNQGQIKQYQKSRKELLEAPETDFAASLKKSLNQYQSELTEANEKVSEIESEYNVLKEQEMNFTMFKSYIARKKIDALSLIVNDFLEKIGSDIRLKLEGYTVTKTGKLRDKISVQVMRDGIDCGSYHKFSGGEKARLNLACILSLHTLTNSNCEYGKGLDFIIIDELLDKSDEVGMATYCEALNKLGQTALLITQGGVAESYPHKLLIIKRHGVSMIQN